MVISYNSQLGLRMNEQSTQVAFLQLMMDKHKALLDKHDKAIKEIEKAEVDESDNITVTVDDGVYNSSLSIDENLEIWANQRETRDKVTALIGEGDTNMIDGNGSKYFFICDSVYKAAELIKIKENFTGRTLKDMEFGKYTYLMGKNTMVRFLVGIGAVKGIYYDDKNNIAFEWGIEMEDGNYYSDFGSEKEFTTIMRVLTFVELGDIEVKMLEAGRNNGGKKNVDKITNTSNKTVYVVDSSWNQIIIRTTGFAVRGHFRLQACGEGLKDRKLIWIDAFEKHGYKRRPTGEIIR